MVSGLVVPSLRWHPEYGYELAESEAREAIAIGCRGALLHGAPRDATTTLLAQLRRLCNLPFIAMAELGGGVGERFGGATALPPLAALDVTDLDAIRRAARVTSREARKAGINWAIAPSCVIPERATRLERARAFAGSDAAAGAACAEWLDACRAEGVVATPGPYPIMRPAAAEAVLDAGVAAMIVTHAHATDRETIQYLRRDAQFTGVIVVDLGGLALARDADEPVLAVECLAAGCDLLAGVEDVRDVVRACADAAAKRVLDAEAIHASVGRVNAAATFADVTQDVREPTLDDALWARRAADAALQLQRGGLRTLRSPVDLIVIDDDPPRAERPGVALERTLKSLGVDARVVRDPTPAERGMIVACVFGDRRLALGFDALSDGAVARVQDVCAIALRSARDVIVAHFTPPDFGDAFAFAPNLLCAWSGTTAMEEAVARTLARVT